MKRKENTNKMGTKAKIMKRRKIRRKNIGKYRYGNELFKKNNLKKKQEKTGRGKS